MYTTMKPSGWSSGRQTPPFRDEPPSSTTRVSGVQGSAPSSCTVKKAFSSFLPHPVLKWKSMMVRKNSNISVALVLKVKFAKSAGINILFLLAFRAFSFLYLCLLLSAKVTNILSYFKFFCLPFHLKMLLFSNFCR